MCDRAEDEDGMKISATTGEGLQTLAASLEEAIMGNTDRAIHHLRIPSGGQHLG